MRPLITASALCLWTSLAAWLCPLAYAKEQHLRYEDEMQVYDLAFDDQKISAAEMRQIVQLSPYLLVDIPSPFLRTLSWFGKNPVDKSFIVPWLEVRNPGYSESGKVTVSPAFSKYAVINLGHGRKEIRLLQDEKLPEVLGPVRSYLLQGLRFSLALQEARYRYFRTGDVGALRRVLCEECTCDGDEEKILDHLKNASDAAARLRVSRYEWQNQVLKCHQARASTYPTAVWKAFLKQFGIRESYHFRHVE